MVFGTFKGFACHAAGRSGGECGNSATGAPPGRSSRPQLTRPVARRRAVLLSWYWVSVLLHLLVLHILGEFEYITQYGCGAHTKAALPLAEGAQTFRSDGYDHAESVRPERLAPQLK